MIYPGLKYKARPVIEVEILEEYPTKKYGLMYRVRETDLLTGKVTENGLLLPEYIKNDLENQAKIIESHKKAIEYDKKRKENEKAERQKELEKQKEYENVYGYLDNKAPLQKGKILKILNVKSYYRSQGEVLGYWTRKDFVYNMINKGCTLEHKKDIKYYGKDYELKTKANEYRLVLPDETFYEITKTEFDYGSYLITENILEV